jgi:hypothetical protein
MVRDENPFRVLEGTHFDNVKDPSGTWRSGDWVLTTAGGNEIRENAPVNIPEPTTLIFLNIQTGDVIFANTVREAHIEEWSPDKKGEFSLRDCLNI